MLIVARFGFMEVRKISDILYVENCRECPYYQKDEYNPSRTYCNKFKETHGERKEISVNLLFPVICPLPKV